MLKLYMLSFKGVDYDLIRFRHLPIFCPKMSQNCPNTLDTWYILEIYVFSNTNSVEFKTLDPFIGCNHVYMYMTHCILALQKHTMSTFYLCGMVCWYFTCLGVVSCFQPAFHWLIALLNYNTFLLLIIHLATFPHVVSKHSKRDQQYWIHSVLSLKLDIRSFRAEAWEQR